MLEFEKVVILRVVDSHWTDHIDAMDQLRESIGLRGYGQLNPLVEYQREGSRMFEEMVADIDYGGTRLFLKAEIRLTVLLFLSGGIIVELSEQKAKVAEIKKDIDDFRGSL